MVGKAACSLTPSPVVQNFSGSGRYNNMRVANVAEFYGLQKTQLHLQAFISLIDFLLIPGHHRNYTNVMIFSKMVIELNCFSILSLNNFYAFSMPLWLRRQTKNIQTSFIICVLTL